MSERKLVQRSLDVTDFFEFKIPFLIQELSMLDQPGRVKGHFQFFAHGGLEYIWYELENDTEYNARLSDEAFRKNLRFKQYEALKKEFEG